MKSVWRYEKFVPYVFIRIENRYLIDHHWVLRENVLALHSWQNEVDMVSFPCGNQDDQLDWTNFLGTGLISWERELFVTFLHQYGFSPVWMLRWLDSSAVMIKMQNFDCV